MSLLRRDESIPKREGPSTGTEGNTRQAKPVNGSVWTPSLFFRLRSGRWVAIGYGRR